MKGLKWIERFRARLRFLRRRGQRTDRVYIGNRRDGGVLYWTAKLYGFAALLAVGSMLGSSILVYSYYAEQTRVAPDFSSYTAKVPGIARIYAGDGTELTQVAKEWREVVSYDEIPLGLIQAFLAAEDHDFFEHSGLFYRGIVRAAWRNLSAGRVRQGGSTITQQVAKHFLEGQGGTEEFSDTTTSEQRTITRKAKEAIMARRLEATYSKKAILSVYLNHIFLGRQTFGVVAAARRFFDKELDELTLGEMATLAGLPQAPSRNSPILHPERAKNRRNVVLDKMVMHGFMSAEQGKALKMEQLGVRRPQKRYREQSPYYVEHVHNYVKERYGVDALTKGGWRIETAVEPVVDTMAYENIDYGIRKQDKRQGWRGPVTTLNKTSEAIFIQRAVAMYGDAPLVPKQRYLGLVKKTTMTQASVQVGSVEYELPLKNMSWASPWSAVEANNDFEILDVREALRVGDVIWVQAEQVNSEPYNAWYLAKGVNPHWLKVMPEKRLQKKREEAQGRVSLEQVPHPQGAIFTGDHETGYVVAMVGGTDFDRSEYNRAYQACRQPASTFKPIYYSAALAQGYGYDSSLNDIPRTEVDPVTGEIWTPLNFQGTVDKQVSLEYAMVFSKNVASLDLFKKLGADNVAAWARRLGFTTPIIADKALALGASCTKLHELTAAFAIFARNGRDLKWTWVRRIVDRQGNVVEDNTVAYDPMLRGRDRLDRVAATAGQFAEQVIPKRAAYLTSKLLRQTIQSGFSSIVRTTGIRSAGKTGTSSDTMDNTFVSYTSRWITTIWMGDDQYVRPLGLEDAAYKTVEPMWARYMIRAADGHPNKEIPWSIPEGTSEEDRGDHSVGEIWEMPLVYLKSAVAKVAVESPE